MRKTLFAAAALTAALSLGASIDRAAAMTAATPTQLGLATADGSLVQKAALVCGRWGCRRVWRGSRVWVGPRVGWAVRRPIYAFAGPRPGWGWGGPAWGVAAGPGWSRLGLAPSWLGLVSCTTTVDWE
jgi:hypothetical protein